MASQLELICGCMFSGKTTALIERVRALQADGRSVLCIKPEIDDRYSETDIVTHNGGSIPAHIVCSVSEITVITDRERPDVVAIDEIHFFEVAFVDAIDALLQRGFEVVCCGLDRDMWGDAFAVVDAVAARGVRRQMLGTCKVCQAPADRTQRIVPLADSGIVGGAEAFEPRCAGCFKPPPEPKSAIHTPGVA